jgi:hypothetical protein
LPKVQISSVTEAGLKSGNLNTKPSLLRLILYHLLLCDTNAENIYPHIINVSKLKKIGVRRHLYPKITVSLKSLWKQNFCYVSIAIAAERIKMFLKHLQCQFTLNLWP